MVPSNKSDKSVKAGANLLLKGWKMLNKACPSCHEPLYEKEGKVACVRCKTNYVLVDSESEMPQKRSSVIQREESKSSLPKSVVSLNFDALPTPLAETAKIMIDKLHDLNLELKKTTDPKKITELTSSIRSIIDSLRSLMT